MTAQENLACFGQGRLIVDISSWMKKYNLRNVSNGKANRKPASSNTKELHAKSSIVPESFYCMATVWETFPTLIGTHSIGRQGEASHRSLSKSESANEVANPKPELLQPSAQGKPPGKPSAEDWMGCSMAICDFKKHSRMAIWSWWFPELGVTLNHPFE